MASRCARLARTSPVVSFGFRSSQALAVMVRPFFLASVLLAPLLIGACANAPTEGTRSAAGADTLRLEPIPEYRQIRDCTADTLPCRIPDAPDRREVERRLGSRTAVAWGGDDLWTIAYRAPDDSVTGVEVGGGVQLPLSRFEGTRLWALALRLPSADSAVVSLRLRVRQGDVSVADTAAIREWRGPLAPPKPHRAERLAGTLRTDSLWRDALGAWRRVTVYLPPGHGRQRRVPVVYLADGQGLSDYARVVDPLVASGELPPVALVGIWVASGAPGGGPARGPAQDLRTIEYHRGVEAIPGADSAFVVARYQGHREFFTEEVRRWAEDALFVSRERQGRAVHGSSSGGNYALTLGRERPDLYDLVIANSNGGSNALAPPEGGWAQASRHVLSAGVLELPSLGRTLTALGDSLRQHGVAESVTIYPSGHDRQVWVESFPDALAWWFAEASPLTDR